MSKEVITTGPARSLTADARLPPKSRIDLNEEAMNILEGRPPPPSLTSLFNLNCFDLRRARYRGGETVIIDGEITAPVSQRLHSAFFFKPPWINDTVRPLCSSKWALPCTQTPVCGFSVRAGAQCALTDASGGVNPSTNEPRPVAGVRYAFPASYRVRPQNRSRG